MKLKLNKNKLKNLSKTHNEMPLEVTPQVGGGLPKVGSEIYCIEVSVNFCLSKEIDCVVL